jgi:uronate dehydrogenase
VDALVSRTIERLLITGAGGGLGRVLRERMRGRFPALRLSDIAPMEPAGPGEEVIPCDLADEAGVADLCRGVDAIVHLGGFSRETDWPGIVAPNILGAIHLWEGAREAGTDRVLFASSNHAIGLYRRAQVIDHTAPPLPDSRYGLSKAFGEDLACLYAYKHGVRGLCMRIGSCFPKPSNARALSTWLSYDDFERLVTVGLTADYTYEIVYGVSRNTRGFWDNRNAVRLGYDPQDDAEAFAGEVAHLTRADPLDEERQGGPYVPPDFTGDPAKLP